MRSGKIFRVAKDFTGLSGYKINFLNKSVLHRMLKKYGYKGLFFFLGNFIDVRHAFSETATAPRMFIKLHIEPTIRCNLNCKMCNRPAGHQTAQDMAFSEFKAIIDKMPSLVDVQFTGLGETLINPHILNMVEYLKLNRIRFGLTTNGILLTKTVSERLLKSNINWIAISVDSANNETYRLIRNHGDVGAVIDNIKNFHNLKTRLKKNVFSELVMVYMEENKDELLDMIDFANKMRFNAVRVKIVEDWRSLNHEHLSITDHLQNLCAAKKKAMGLGIKFTVTAQIKDSDYRKLFKSSASKCESPWFHVGILYNGDIVPCCLKTPQRNYVLGNIFKMGFDDIWNNSAYRAFRSAHLLGEPPGMCNYCTRIVLK